MDNYFTYLDLALFGEGEGAAAESAGADASEQGTNGKDSGKPKNAGNKAQGAFAGGEAATAQGELDLGNDDDAREAEAETPAQADPLEQHFETLRQQSEAFRRSFPVFDLHEEMKNPTFVRLTAPGLGISVEDAFYTVHRRELEKAARQVTAQDAARMLANSLQTMQRRPAEAGAAPAALTAFDYAHAPKEQREALKKQIYAARGRGEKIYPGR